jgi:calcium-translocating P-type ATPase
MTQSKIAEKTKNVRAKGLSYDQVVLSRERHGANIIQERRKKSFLRRFFENLGDPVIRILLGALAVNLIFVFRGGDLAETIGIGISVFLAAFISALSESGGENAFRRLSSKCESQECRVRRNGRLCRVPIEDIVVGDIVILSAGERAPADGYIVCGELYIDQSSITGESKEARKCAEGESTPLPSCKRAVFRGCNVLSGEAELEIFAVGDDSFLGKISMEVQTDTRESPLKVRLTKLAGQISKLGYGAAILISLAYLFNCFVLDSGFEWSAIALKLRDMDYLLQNLLHAFMLGLTIVVVAVPEGLPMMIAVVLSSNIRRMVRDNVLVRKPVGIEAAGSMNLLFTDKTGTLTEGKMSVDKIVAPDGKTYAVSSLMRSSPAIGRLYSLSCLCNTGADISEGVTVGGNGTERALLDSVKELCGTSKPRIVRRLQFDSAIKYSAAEIMTDGRPLVLVKGAPERLMPHVRRYVTANGDTADMSSGMSAFNDCVSKLCEDGKRLILIAVADEMATASYIPSLTLVCAVSLGDPLRAQARSSVEKLRGAGIGVVMITGDGKQTAEAIARGCGIIGGERKRVVDGEELSKMSDDAIAALLPTLAVISRALPTDKSRLVRVAQNVGAVVGMTGDGINDAPALKCADIGFAMGSGTDVAKDAGDIIILDNDLASIVKAVLYGRNIFKSIRKFITLQLTMNFCAVGVSMIGPFIGIDAPVTVVQMLWVNIIMDTLGGLAFAGEAPSPLCMKEKPKRRDEPILNGYMVDQIVLLGGFTVALCLFFLLSPSVGAHFRYSHDNIYLLTAFFALFIFTSVLNCFNCRCDRLSMLTGISKNPAFIAIMAVICVVQIFFVYLGGEVLRTMPLLVPELVFTLTMSLAVVPAELVRRLIWRLRGKKYGF